MNDTSAVCTQNLNEWGLSWQDAVAGLLLQGVPAPDIDKWVNSGCAMSPAWRKRMDQLARGNTVGYAPSSVPGYPPFQIPVYPAAGACPRAQCYMRPGDMDPTFYGRPGFFGATIPTPPMGGQYGPVGGWSGSFPGDGMGLYGAWLRLIPRGMQTEPVTQQVDDLPAALGSLQQHVPISARIEVDRRTRTLLVFIESQLAFDHMKPCAKPHRIGSWDVAWLVPVPAR